MSTSWSEIPTDLLYSLLSKVSIPDLFRSAAVCSHWSAVVDKLRRSPGDQRPQIPWLVPEGQFLIDGDCNSQNNYNFFSLSEGRVYDIPSPATRLLKTVVGSSHGWLITVRKVSVQLLNPITQVHINLPSTPTVGGRHLEAVKAVLSSDPSGGGDYSVVLEFYSCSMRKKFLFFVNAGDEKWTMISGGGYHDDIVFHKGKLYAVTRCELHAEVMVAAYDLITMDSTPTWTPVVALSDFVWGFKVVSYFLSTSSDDLLLTRIMMNEPENYINKLEVWKVDTEKCVVNTMNNLGEYSLFLSAASSLCIDTSSLPDLKSNSIYISIDLYDIGISDNLIYSMEDESFTSLSLPPLSSPRRLRRSASSSTKLQRPVLVWFAPSIGLHADPM
ncbi:F-box/kelch-repeat protein At1g57790-like [Zingiber officinale]|uniref:F-box/kelch-repeat protein At1g57790-like n=1 Tax=Zingiber officinale TaxID=94328 RepID=UPI001C4A7813|nr:F-box/kelch-repeat protein At1g57790-like [Zingiber officinale]